MWRYAYPDPDEGGKARVTWDVVRRVLGYAQPFRLHIFTMLVLILLTTGLRLLTPLFSVT